MFVPFDSFENLAVWRVFHSNQNVVFLKVGGGIRTCFSFQEKSCSIILKLPTNISPALGMVTWDLCKEHICSLIPCLWAFRGFLGAIAHPTTSVCFSNVLNNWRFKHSLASPNKFEVYVSSQHVAHTNTHFHQQGFLCTSSAAFLRVRWTISPRSWSIVHMSFPCAVFCLRALQHCTTFVYDWQTNPWIWVSERLGVGTSVFSQNYQLFGVHISQLRRPKVIDGFRVQNTRISESQHLTNLTWFPCNGLSLFLETSPNTKMGHFETWLTWPPWLQGLPIKTFHGGKQRGPKPGGEGRIHGIPASNSQSRNPRHHRPLTHSSISNLFWLFA